MGENVKKWFKKNKNEIATLGIILGYGYCCFGLGRMAERMSWMHSLIDAKFSNMEGNSNDIQTDRNI